MTLTLRQNTLLTRKATAETQRDSAATKGVSRKASLLVFDKQNVNFQNVEK